MKGIEEEKDKKVVWCLGPEGTFGEEATLIFLKEKKMRETEIGMKSRNEEIVTAVAEWDDIGIVPIYNGIAGPVLPSIDAIIENQLYIQGEILLPIEQNLIVFSKDIQVEDITTVVSHPNALIQCRKWIEENLPQANTVKASSTAEAVWNLRSPCNGAYDSAIASESAAKKCHRYIIKRGIQDRENFTRFVVVGRKPINEARLTGQKYITSMIIELPNTYGALYQILKEFYDFKINIDWLEVRPSRMNPPTTENPGNVLFWMDIDEQDGAERLRQVVEKIERKTKYLRILGTYPRHYPQK